MTDKQRAILALSSGLGMGLAPAPLHWFGLAWLAFAPLWWLCRGAAWRSRLLYGLLWGCGYYGLTLLWITGIHPMTWMGVPWLASVVIALGCWLLITLWGCALAVSWALLWPLLAPPSAWGCWLVGITLWCALESLWQQGPLWWATVALTQSPHNGWILHWGQVSGPTAITALIIGVNGLLAEGIILNQAGRTDKSALALSRHLIRYPESNTPQGRETQPIRQENSSGLMFGFEISVFLLPLLLLAGALGIGYGIAHLPRPAGQPFTVGIIQGNVPNEIKLYREGWLKAIAGYTQGYVDLAAQGVDVIVTPETALPNRWTDMVRDRHPFYRAIEAEQVPVWVGAFGRQGQQWTNSLFSVSATGQTFSQYDKVKLVPLGEYIPLAQILGRVINRLSPLDAQLAAGDAHQQFKTPFGRAIVGICYESAFPEHFRRQAAQGGEFIVTASNNAHYSETMPLQHHALDVMRAIESDRWAIRATNTGYSAIVDPHGHTRWFSGINTYETHAATVERRTTQTLYVRWGDWLLWVLILLSGLSWVLPKNYSQNTNQ